ncbi:hypothetical protein J2D73_19850, partial [Acetobacter sacchari]
RQSHAQKCSPVIFQTGSQLDLDFTRHAAILMSNWNGIDLKEAKKFALERGPRVIEQSLLGGYQLFQKVKLPDHLPDTIDRLARAQERWFSPITSGFRPAYIGSWNACALFMVALFANPDLAFQMKTVAVCLPPGGPIYRALRILSDCGILSAPPESNEFDESSFEPGSIYANNALIAELVRGNADLCMTTIHSGLYILGSREPRIATWFSL